MSATNTQEQRSPAGVARQYTNGDPTEEERTTLRELFLEAYRELKTESADGQRNYWPTMLEEERSAAALGLILSRVGMLTDLERLRGRGWLRPGAKARYLAEVDALYSPGERPVPPDPLIALGARWLAEVSTDPPSPLLVGRLDPVGHTIMFGAGGTGKGVLTSEWVVRLVRAGLRVLIADYENHPEEWARRIAGLGGADAMAGVVHVAPLTAGWQGVRGSLWQQQDDLRALAQAVEADVLVVDSIVPASAGEDPQDTKAPALYTAALEYIGLPTLSLAHVTKGEDLRYPFGSAFWHNLARLTWSLQRDGERAILQSRKANNYPNLGRYVVETTWRDNRPGEVFERSYAVALTERIDEALEDEPDGLTVVQIVGRLNDTDDGQPVKADSVRKSLRRGIGDRYTVDGTGDASRWRRA